LNQQQKEKIMNKCPCGSKLLYSQCCEPIIKGEKPAQTAEQLMRSRYSAYAKKELDYIFQSTHPNQRGEYDEAGTRRWSEKSQWDGLEIVNSKMGGEKDTKGTVEFIAHFRYKGNKQYHHESADFLKENGTWYFCEGHTVPQKPVVRTEPKVGRNDPCPCGSGLKYKKCCAKAS
jgi:SEC-C motif-containing protein